MQRITLRLTVVLATFFIGVAVVSIWFFNPQANFDAAVVDISTTEKEFVTNESSAISTINEDYAVYSAILTIGQYNDEVTVINDYTSHGLMADATNLNQKIYKTSCEIQNQSYLTLEITAI